MTDITKCSGENCKASLKTKCYRYTSPCNSHYQSFFSASPNDDGICEEYIDNGEVEDEV